MFAAAGLFLKGIPSWAWAVIGAVMLLVAFYFALDAYGDSRYDAGKKDADAAWIAASDKLVKKAQDAGTKADKAAAGRMADQAAKVEDEKEKIDAAKADGSSPFDVLFPSAR
jgi:hypothetical protein